MSKESALIVYVQLGDYPAKTLEVFAGHTRDSNPNLPQVLVTDGKYPVTYPFKRRISHADISKPSKLMLARKPFYKSQAKSYWLNTFERLFALRLIADTPLFQDLPIIHVESDVLPFITEEVLTFLKSNFTTLCVPRHDPQRGIGSFVYAPNHKELLQGLDHLESLMKRNSKIIDNDMELLGLGLNNGLIQELPTHPSQYDSRKFKCVGGQRFIFDGAAIGQYLFGQDPFHQKNYRISGFKNPDYRKITRIEDFVFRVEDKGGRCNLIGNFKNHDYSIVNLHIHSKELIPALSNTDERWKRAMDEASGRVIRFAEFVDDISPHAQTPSFTTRLQIARSKGFGHTFKSYILKRLKYDI